MAQSQTNQSQSQTTTSRFNVSQGNDQTRQAYSEFQNEFRSVEERIAASSYIGERYQTRALEALEEASMWIQRGINESRATQA